MFNSYLVNRRMWICKKCEFLENKDSMLKKCTKCGCMMEAKVRLPLAKCPLNKW
jgi:rubrerythrin